MTKQEKLTITNQLIAEMKRRSNPLYFWKTARCSIGKICEGLSNGYRFKNQLSRVYYDMVIKPEDRTNRGYWFHDGLSPVSSKIIGMSRKEWYAPRIEFMESVKKLIEKEVS